MGYSKLFAIFFLIFSFTTFASSTSSNNDIHKCSAKQSEALLLFKHNLLSINDTFFPYECQDYHPIMMNWNASADCCNWDGVTCDRSTGDVIGLDLSCGRLQGTIHPNTSLFNLPHLQTLNLAFNNFSGSQIPREIGRFSNSLTHLNLSDSGFSGQVPPDITLHHNKLVSLDLSWNDLKLGPDVFINMFRNFTNLEQLSLGDVNISSILPTSLNISSSLKLLNLDSTGMKGKLPHYIFNLHSLETLDLSYNSFTGDIPSDISVNLTQLTSLYLQDNRLNGTLPSWLFTSPSLQYLDLRSNMFSGNVPFESFTSPSLEEIYLSDNMLRGNVPSDISINLTHLTSLDLSFNKLNGTLPSWLFTSPSLEFLFLDNNMFSGNVPFESFSLPSLTFLDLSNNYQLGGQIDVQTFPQLTNLTQLDLGYNNFSGELELDTLLSTLTNLESLRLSYSGFSVTTKNANHYVNPRFWSLHLASCKLKVFPNSFRAMKQLYHLDLSSNEIHGQIPHWAGEIGGTYGLEYVNLSHNFIKGLPQFQWYGLHELYLQSNLIEGPFPPSICNMSYLVYLDMSNNRFDGVIPQCLGNITSYLEMLDMGNNSFQGTIPNVFENSRGLGGLILNGNQLEGEVPSSLSKCSYLKVLDLGNNHLNGIFPSWLEGLPYLRVLVLKSNRFHGPIQPSPAVKFPFPSLQVLDVSRNRFVGQLPGKYFQNFNSMKNVVKNSTTPKYLSMGYDIYYSFVVAVKGVDQDIPRLFVGLTIIDLSNNYFEREIPEIIGNLSSLKELNLSHNSLNGRIPDSLGKLSEIESLDLSWNQLTGNIPQSLADLTFLEFLNLSKNHLEGSIPQGNQLRTFEENSYSGNPKLCGFPLPRKCKEYLHELQPEADEDDEESGFTWKMVMLGYGCGTIIGLVMGYLMLSSTRPNWLSAIADAGERMILKRRDKRRSVYMGK